MATSKWQEFKQRHLGGTTHSSSFSPLEQRPSSQQLYNSYAKAAEEDESEWEKFKRKHNVGAQMPQGIVEHQRAQEKSYKAQAEQSNAQMAARAQMLPELQSKIDNGMTLNPTEELQYARASIEALSEGERSAMSQIKKGQDQNFSDHARYDMNGSLGFGQQLINKYVTKTDAESGTGNKTIKEAQEILRSEYGWDEDKIKNYTLMSERLSNAQGTEEYNKAFEISQDDSNKLGKAAANTAWNLFNAPTEGVMGALSNLRAKPEGFGRDTNSWVNLRQNSSDAATEQVVQNAITDSRPAGQFLYQAGLSTAESAARAMTGSSFGNGKLRSAITTGMSAAGVYNSSYQNARERGASDTQAQLFGIASGAAEAAGEFFSLEHFWKMAEGTKAGKQLAVQWLAQAGIEAGEEAVTDLLTRVADYMVLGKDGKSEFALTKSAYMDQGMSEEEATQNAEKDFWKQVKMDALGGAISGGIFGAGGFVAGNMNAAQNKQRAEAVQGHFKDADVDTSSEYGAALKQDADRYANNPTQYMADMIDDSTEEGKQRKAEVQKLAQKEAQGQRLSASDRNYIEESLYVAENAAQQSETAMSARDRYNQYANEMAAVPAEYRTAATSITEDEARADLGKAAANKDIEALGEIYSKMKNAKSADLRNKADEIYAEYYGMAESKGITREQLEAFKISPQEAYYAGLKGEGRGNVGALSMKAAEAYRAGQQAYQNNKNATVVESKSNLQKANVSTKDGKNVVLSGVFSSNGNVLTQDGQQVSVSDLNLGDSAVQKAYGYADTQPSVMAKNAYLGNIKDGMNIESYDIAFKSVFRAGRSGMEYDSMIQNGKYKLYAEVLGKDTVRAMYDAGVAQTQMEKTKEATEGVNAAFKLKKGAGVFEDARIDKSDKMNTEVLRMMANVTGLNIRLVDDKGALKKEGANAYFDRQSSTVVVGSHATAQVFHEVLGEFTKLYNSSDYAVMRKAAMAASAEVLGEDTFNKTMDSYAAAYGKAGESNTDIEMSDEMTNDYAVALMSTDKGRQALINYLMKNCTQKEANSIKDKIVNLYKSMVRSIKNIINRSNLMSYQKKLLENNSARLEKDAELFVKAFAKAVENYKATEDGATVTEDKAFSIMVDSEGNELTEGQREYFKDSKVVDEKGRLIVVYHGTRKADFTVFNRNHTYFTDSKAMADSYAPTGEMFVGYLNIEKPYVVDARGERWSKIPVDKKTKDILERYGGSVFKEGGKWRSTPADVVSAIEDGVDEGEFDYDGVIIQNVDDTGVYWEDSNKHLANDYIAFSSKQFKNINNENPTDDPDIRYSINVDYNTLVSKNDIEIASSDGFEVIEYSPELTRTEVRDVVKRNVELFNKNKGNNLGDDEIFNKDLNGKIKITNKGIKHGLERMRNVNYDAYSFMPVILDNAIVINEGVRNGEESYVMIGAYINKEGNVCVARAVVSKKANQLNVEEIENVLSSIRTKKERVASNASGQSYNSYGLSPSSTISVAELLEEVKKVYPNELSEDVANHLGYKRGKSDIEGLKYSLEVDDFFDIFGGEDTDFASSASILEEGMEALKHQKVDSTKVRSVAHKIRKEFGSTINFNTLVDNLEKVFAYMQTSDHVNYNDMMRVLYEVATPVIDQATTLTGKEEYDAFVNAMKGYSVRLTDAQKQEVVGLFGTYGQFRRMMMPLNISDNGSTDLESVWSEIAEASGGVLDADTVEGDMPTALYDALSALRPSPVNSYGGNKDDVAKDVAMRIVEEYLGIHGAKAKEAAQKMKKQREEFEKALKETKTKNRQAATKARRKRLADHEKKMIAKRAGELMKWVSNPTEKHHVPRSMVEPVVEFLYALDFVEPDVKQNKDGKWYVRVFSHSVIGADGSRSHVFDTLEANTRDEALQMFYDAIGSGAGSKTQKKWTERMRMIENIFNQVASGKPFDNREMDDFMETIDPALAEEFTDMLQRNGGVAYINQLEYEDLHLINKALRGITHAINQGNKAFTNNATIEEMARSTIEKADSKKVSDRELEIGKSIKKLLNLDMLTPKTYFHIQGKGGDMVYDALRKGFNTEIMDIKKAQEFMAETLKDAKDLSKWTGVNAVVYEIPTSAGTIRLTTDQIMSLYMMRKRKQVMEHMAGGFRPDTIASRSLMLFKNILKQPDFHLTETDIKNITDNLTTEQKRVAEKMQKFLAVDCAVWGNETSLKLYDYEKFVDPNYFPITTVSHTNMKKNENIATETLNGIERQGFTKQIKEGAKNPILIRSIFDVFTEHVEGMAAYHGKAAAIKDANRWFNYRVIQENGWQQTWKTTQEAIEINSGAGGVKYYTKLMSDINGQTRSQYIGDSKLMSNYKAASVGFNLRVVLQQPTAYIRAMNVIDPKYLMSVNPKKVVGAGKRVKEKSPIAWWKAQGHRENSVSKSMRDTIVGDATLMDKFKDISMAAAGKADDITWGMLYEAVIKEQRDVTKGMGLTEEQFQQRVNDRFDEVVDKTQVVDSVLHRSQFMRSKDKLNVLQSAFMSEPTKTYNMMYESLRSGKKQAARAVATYMITAAATSAAASVADMIRYTEDGEEPDEVWWENFIKNFMENIIPCNLIPTIKDVAPYLVSFITGESTYTSSNRMDMDAIYNMANAFKELQKAASGESNKSFYGVAYSVAQGFSQLTGVPASNIAREVVSIYNLFMPDIKKTKTSNPYNLIYDEIKKKNGDVEAKVKFVMSNDGNISDIESGITSRYKSDYYEAYQEDPKKAQKIADEAKIGLVAIGMTEAEADATIEGWQTKKKTYTEIDKAIESGEGIVEEIEALKEEKEAEDIAEHIVNEYSSTIEYNRKNDIQSNVEANVNDALKAIDRKYSYDERKNFYKAKADKKAADDALTEKKNASKQVFFDSIDSGNLRTAQKSVHELLELGVDGSTIKDNITEQYRKKMVADRKAGKDINAMKERVISIRVYVDEVTKPSSIKDYREHEKKVVEKWFKD